MFSFYVPELVFLETSKQGIRYRAKRDSYLSIHVLVISDLLQFFILGANQFRVTDTGGAFGTNRPSPEI